MWRVKDYSQEPGEASFMWRTTEHKLILCFDRKADATEYTAAGITGGEFYDLKKDPEEWKNLYRDPAYREIRESMATQLLAHIAKLGPKISRAPE